MHQLIDKKNKILTYLILLIILSTTSGKFVENQNSYSSKINQINIEGLSNANNSKIYNELNSLFYKNILLIGKEELEQVIGKYNIIQEYNIKKIYPSTINISIKPTQFVARLSSNDQLVGINGKLIEDKENNDILPYIFGEFNSQDFLISKKILHNLNLILRNLKHYIFFLQIGGIF
tara:strand:+ start:40 stop:570 length:531 start_codon:yes stop_codon:yes gene_type:complete